MVGVVSNTSHTQPGLSGMGSVESSGVLNSVAQPSALQQLYYTLQHGLLTSPRHAHVEGCLGPGLVQAGEQLPGAAPLELREPALLGRGRGRAVTRLLPDTCTPSSVITIIIIITVSISPYPPSTL